MRPTNPRPDPPGSPSNGRCELPRRKPAWRITRGLRFRLTASYALFFTLVLVGVGFLFRQTLATSLNDQARAVLDQEWAAIKGYLIIQKNQPIWFYDREDPDEAFIVERIRRVYLLADASGKVLEPSTIYQSLGFDPPERIQEVIRQAVTHHSPAWSVRYSPRGIPFLIRAGVVYDEGHHAPYFLAIGRSLAEDRDLLRHFTWTYVGLIPLMILGGCVLGWMLAGHALTPVLSVARTAQRISGSNLSLRIPTRHAGDELDYLIETFNQMIERLEHSFQQIRQFSTDVSHELRTPITVIRGQLEVALFTAKTEEQYREAILNALQDVERLSQIVRALLLLSQAESGQVALQKSTLDLSSLVREVVDQFQIPAEGNQVRLRASLDGECPAEVDRLQIERMLSNLLSNAIKFTPAGGDVEVSLRRHDGEVELAVEDTGCGIPTEHLPHIFDRFYRVRGAEQETSPERGLGLGLSFVAWIVRAHGGRIDVDSTPGKGSRFTVRLPAATPSPNAVAVIGIGMNEL